MRGKGTHLIAKNRKAFFNYHVEDRLECGIALEGTEVKSVRAGHLSFPDAFAEMRGGELWLKNVHIAEYVHACSFAPNPDRMRKLLAHRDQIARLKRKVEEKGYTLVPLEFYLKAGLVKVALGICKGKKLFDKRAQIKARDNARELSRSLCERHH